MQPGQEIVEQRLGADLLGERGERRRPSSSSACQKPSALP